MSVFDSKKARAKRGTVAIRKALDSNGGDSSFEKKKQQREAFWADALKSDSILFWVVTHLPKLGQS